MRPTLYTPAWCNKQTSQAFIAIIKVKVAKSRDASDRCWPISREWNVLETPKCPFLTGRGHNKCIFHTCHYYAYSILMYIWLTTAIRREFELHECLLVSFSSILVYCVRKKTCLHVSNSRSLYSCSSLSPPYWRACWRLPAGLSTGPLIARLISTSHDRRPRLEHVQMVFAAETECNRIRLLKWYWWMNEWCFY